MTTTSYDAEARRETALALKLKEHIRTAGPISVRRYMAAALGDAEHGYYRCQTAIGASGDFVTAPEISQVFGELIGLWTAVVWQSMGQPQRVRLVEIGPGRGTLLSDALRALRVVPAFLAALEVHLVEPSAVLAAAQRETHGAARVPISWHGSLDELAKSFAGSAPAPLLVVANEFLDTCAARQLLVTETGLVERGVAVDTAGALQFVALGPVDEQAPGWAPPGAIVEQQDFGFLAALADLAAGAPMAALFIDYGHTVSSAGETLQAVRQHAAEHPLTSPGEADLTVQVDFAAFGEQAGRAGFAVDGPVTQAQLLGRLGIMERASRLMAANPARSLEIEAGVARLMAPVGMGSRFKAIGLRRGLADPLPGLSGS